MSNYRDQVKQFAGVVRIQDIKNEFDRLVNGINSVVSAINAIGDLADHDYSVGGNNISAPNYTMTLGALKQFLSAYDDKTVIRAPIIKCPGDNNYYKAFPGLYCDSDIGIIQTPDTKFDAGQSSHTITEEKDINTYLTVQKGDGYVFSRSYITSNMEETTTSIVTPVSDSITLDVPITTQAAGYEGIDYTISAGYTPIIACGDLQVGDVIYYNDIDLENHSGGASLVIEPVLSFYDTSSSKILHEPIALIRRFGYIWTFYDGADTRNSDLISYVRDSEIGSERNSVASKYTVTNITSSTITLHLDYMPDGGNDYTGDGGNFTIQIPEGYRCNAIFLAVRLSDTQYLNVDSESLYSFYQNQCYLMRGDTRYDFITENTTLIGGETTETVVTNPETDKNIYLNKEDKSLSMVKFNDDDVMIDICCCSKNNTPEMSQNAVANIGVNTNTAIVPNTIPTLSMNTKQFNLTDADTTLGEPKFYLGKAGDRDSTGRIYLNGKQIFANIYNYFGDAHRRHRATWQYNPLWIPRGITLPFSGVMRAIKALTFKWN